MASSRDQTEKRTGRIHGLSALALIPDVDMFVLGGRMYPDYGEYWKAILANPERVPPFQERIPSKSEIAYARNGCPDTPRRVVDDARERLVAAHCADRPERRAISEPSRSQPGKNVYVVGGATLVASLLNEDLIDELRLIVHPVVLGKGRALFDGINKRLSLDLVQAKSTESGRVIVSYRTANVANSASVSDLSRCYSASAVGI